MPGKYLQHSVLLLFTSAIALTGLAAQPIDGNATAETVQLWRNLGKISQDHVLFGHQESLAYGYDWIGEPGRSDIRDITGSYPAVYGWDFGGLWDDSPEALKYNINMETLLQWVKEGSSRGGIITFSWHAPNPISGGDFYDTTEVVSTILPGGENHAAFLSMLDRLADFFHAALPIPIIFRPYHEHNGDWFWWGKTHASEADYIKLWRFTVEYLRDTKEVHNVLYAFSPDRSRMRPDSEKDYLYAYPGDDYVDILGLDNYFDLGSHWNKAPVEQQEQDFITSLELVVRLAEERGKIPALTESSLDKLEYPDWWIDRLLAGINANEQTRKIAWVLVWRNANAENEGRDHFHTPHAKHPGVDDFRAFKDSELILFEDELPDWFKVTNSTDAAPPNIVFIFADDLGYGDLECFGASDIKTPAIDSLASDGIRFTDFYSVSPVCSPSRAGLLTGRYPVRMGIHEVFFPESFTGIDPGEITIAELLKAQGYRTGIVGKWHLGHHYKHLPLQNGFDEYFGIPYSNDMEMVVYMRGNDVESYAVDQHYTTRSYTEEAISFIERSKDQPFFLYLAHSMPHVPLYVSEAFEGGSNRGLYGDVIQELDWSVQQILDTLEAHDISQNTLVVFTSDNGPWLVMKEHGGSAGPLREGKQFTFDGGMRVPTVARWPARIPAGTVSTNMANMMDWFPTFAGIAGSALPEDRPIDGKDLLPALTATGNRGGDEMFFFHPSGELRAFRKGDWKIKLPYEGNEAAPWRTAVAAHPLSLWDLASDLGERKNLAEQYPDRAQTMLARMEEFLESLGELPPRKIVRTSQDRSHFEHLKSGHTQ